jgi:hypothetical protein
LRPVKGDIDVVIARFDEDNMLAGRRSWPDPERYPGLPQRVGANVSNPPQSGEIEADARTDRDAGPRALWLSGVKKQSEIKRRKRLTFYEKLFHSVVQGYAQSLGRLQQGLPGLRQLRRNGARPTFLPRLALGQGWTAVRPFRLLLAQTARLEPGSGTRR